MGKPLIKLILTAILCILTVSGCTTTPNEFAAKQKWIEINFPDREKFLQQLPGDHTFFHHQVMAGQIVKGMSYEEALIATDTSPFGPKKNNTLFWCNDLLANNCDSKCLACASVLILKKSVVLLKGMTSQLAVVIVRKKERSDTINHYQVKNYQDAEILFNNRTK
jgi:hypothetical protein